MVFVAVYLSQSRGMNICWLVTYDAIKENRYIICDLKTFEVKYCIAQQQGDRFGCCTHQQIQHSPMDIDV